jgi:hypothetical protein
VSNGIKILQQSVYAWHTVAKIGVSQTIQSFVHKHILGFTLSRWCTVLELSNPSLSFAIFLLQKSMNANGLGCPWRK